MFRATEKVYFEFAGKQRSVPASQSLQQKDSALEAPYLDDREISLPFSLSNPSVSKANGSFQR
jgi:hypothetical protein